MVYNQVKTLDEVSAEWLDFQQFRERFMVKEIEEYPNRVIEKIPEPVVTILVVTYQHVKYIERCLESVLEQQTDFLYEIIIGDDDSTDGTRNICIEYANKYPDKIRLFLHNRENNIHVLGKPCLIFQFGYNLYKCRGKYIAFISGDDYWNDPNKLQKQATFLLENPEYVMCYHQWSKLHNEKKEIEHFTVGEKQYPMPLTRMVRNIFNVLPAHFFNVLQEDTFMLFMLKNYGKIKYINNIDPAIYRIHSSNMWASEEIEFKRKSEVHTAIQLHNAYSNTTYNYETKVNLYKQLLRYLQEKRIKKNFFSKILFTFSKIFKYNLWKAVFGVWMHKWQSRIERKLKVIQCHLLFIYFQRSNNGTNNNKPTIIKDVSVNVDSGIYKSGSKIVLDSFFGRNKIKRLLTVQAQKEFVSNTMFFTIQHGPWDNYYHWYIDSLPRIWGLYSLEIEDLDTPIILYLSKRLKDDDIAILHSILPKNVKIEWCQSGTLIKGRKAVYLPFLSSDCSASLPSEYLDYYLAKTEALFNLKSKNDCPEKIYISRKHADKRNFKNEEEVRKELLNEGYVVVELEKYSIAEQAAFFYFAKKIVAQHGAALTNLLYARDADVIEVFHSKNIHLNHYRDLAKAKRLTYTPIYLSGKTKNENLIMPLDLLRKIM